MKIKSLSFIYYRILNAISRSNTEADSKAHVLFVGIFIVFSA
jgi:hypothetical protein